MRVTMFNMQSRKILRKLEEYECLVCSDLSNTGRILDARFSNDFWICKAHLSMVIALPQYNKCGDHVECEQREMLFGQLFEIGEVVKALLLTRYTALGVR